MYKKYFFDAGKFISVMQTRQATWDKADNGYFLKNKGENAWKKKLKHGMMIKSKKQVSGSCDK